VTELFTSYGAALKKKNGSFVRKIGNMVFEYVTNNTYVTNNND